jgi:hypothetical protein
MIRIGTSNYESVWAAKREYGDRYDSAIKEGRISVGKPELKPGDVLLIDKDTRRYFIGREEEK